MKSIFKLYIFKLVILSLTMIFISFGANAKSNKFFKERDCDYLFYETSDLLNKSRETLTYAKKNELLNLAYKLGMLYQIYCKAE